MDDREWSTDQAPVRPDLARAMRENEEEIEAELAKLSPDVREAIVAMRNRVMQDINRLTVGPEAGETVTITVRREDAYVVALGPLDYTIESTAGRVPAGGSPRRVREALAVALGIDTEQEARDGKKHDG